MKRQYKNTLIVVLLAVCVVLLGLLTNSIMERRMESQAMAVAKNDLGEFHAVNEDWSPYYPKEYQSWAATADTNFRSKYMGSGHQDMLEERPEMVILWAGYGFAKDYDAPKGHAYSIQDVRKTLRTGAPMQAGDGPMPATCWTCKSPDVPRMMAQMGIANFYASKWGDLGHEIVNPIGCADCHDPKTMNLTITRPALVEAYKRMGKDISKVSHQEMRSLVCAQCHVEYYFKGKGNYLTLPWDKGQSVEAMEAYYDNSQFTDFTHKLSRAPIIKAQHPDFEIFSQGIHAQRGVSCADCHMPYKSEGGVKFTDHHISSPLRNVNNTCQVCHRESEETLIANVYERQDKVYEIRNQLEKELARAHILAKYAWDNGATEAQMHKVLQDLRKSQWRWDYITASHGAPFHAPIESERVLSAGLYYAMQAQMELERIIPKAIFAKFSMPDISTKAKAQKYVGLDMPKLRAAKEKFLQEKVPEWLQKARANGHLLSAKTSD